MHHYTTIWQAPTTTLTAHDVHPNPDIQGMAHCQIPSSPPLLYTINAFLILLRQYPVSTTGTGGFYPKLLLDLSATMAELDERVQTAGRFDPEDSWMHNMSQHCFYLFLQILCLFPENAVMPNVIAIFKQYLRDPPIMIQPSINISEYNLRGAHERRMSNASTSSEVSYIQEYLSNRDENAAKYHELDHISASYLESGDESDYWNIGSNKARATPKAKDATRFMAHHTPQSESHIMRPIMNLPRGHFNTNKTTRPLSNLRFSFGG